ncbi:MAG: DNA-3-methyladenine glycosylase [Acidobacteriota bacterium]
MLGRRFYARPTLDVARDLLGKVLVHRAVDGTTAGVIVETEAYIGESDPACHAAPGPTKRNAPLYGPPGHAYVYFNYGVHWLVNAVTEPEGSPAAVLIRALSPIEGLDVMRARRGLKADGRRIPDCELCRGPGNVTRAMGICGSQNRADLTARRPDTPPSGRRDAGFASGCEARSRLWIEDRGVAVPDVTWTRRIGISVGTEPHWRCCVTGDPAVSAGRQGAPISPAGAARGAGRGRGTRPSARLGRRRS